MAKEIMSVGELRTAIKNAKLVLCQVRFGVSEQWVKLAKQEALELVKNADNNQTPGDFEMYGDTFGSIGSDGILYLG